MVRLLGFEEARERSEKKKKGLERKKPKEETGRE